MATRKKPKFTKSLFGKPKDKVLAGKISIKSPSEFRASIKKLKSGGITLKEKRALTLARTRAQVQLKRKNLSPRERRQMQAIARTELPKVTRTKNGRKTRRAL